MTDSHLSTTERPITVRRQPWKANVRSLNRRLIPALLFAATFLPTSTTSGQLPLRVAEVERTDAVNFGREILPLLRRNCLACHHAKEPEGGLVLESHESLLNGGDSEESVVPHDPAASLLMARVTGSEEPLMPPEDNAVGAKPLTAEELGLLKLWIEQGASGGARSERTSIAWQPLPETVNPINAITVSPDGQLAACGRGNQVTIHDLKTGEEVARLIDPNLAGRTGSAAAELDVVQSIAYAPDGERIATGGFRSVKLWRRVNRPLPRHNTPLANAAGWVAATSDGSRLAMTNAIGDIEIWDLTRNQHLHTLQGHADPVIGLTWNGHGDRVVSGDASGRIIAWNAHAGTEVAAAQSRRSLLPGLAVSQDGTWVAAVDADRHVGLWRFRANEVGSSAQRKFVLQATEIDAVTTIADATSVAVVAAPAPLLAVGTEAGAVLMIGLDSGALVRQLDHGAPVNAVAGSPDGTKIATGGRDGRLRLWKIETGDIVRSLESDSRASHRNAIAERNLARQNALVARLTARAEEVKKLSATEAGALAKVKETRDKAAAQLAAAEQKREDTVTSVARTEGEIAQARQAAEAARQAAAAAEKLAAEFDTTKLTVVAELEKHTAARDTLAEQLVAQEQMVTHAAEAVAAAEASIAEARQEVEAAAMNATTAAASAESLVANLESQQKAAAAAEEAIEKSRLELANRQQACASANAAADRATAAVPAHQEVVEFETRRSGELQQRLAAAKQRLAASQSPVNSVTFSRDGRWLSAAYQNGAVQAYWPSDGAVRAVFEGTADGSNRLVMLADKEVCLCGVNRPPTVWALQPRWEHERTIGTPEDSAISDRVTALDFRPDGLVLAVGSGSPSRVGDVKIFSVNGGQLVRDFGEVHSDTVLGLRFSPDGRFLASSAADKTIRLLDVAEGRLVRSLEGHTHHVLAIAWHDDGQTLASASADNQVKIWDTSTGEQTTTLDGFPKEIAAIAFVAQTSQVVTACADGRLRLHDATDEKLIRTFDASGDFLFALALTPDGGKLLAGGHHGVLRVWSVADGKLLHELP